MQNRGMVYVFTGEGKGKTSAAIGVTVRAVGVGMKVAWIGFYKQASWKLTEVKPLQRLGVAVYLMGKGFHLPSQSGKTGVKMVKVKTGQVVVDGVSSREHKQAAAAAIQKARELLGGVDLLVLDEVNNAVSEGLLEAREIRQLIEGRKRTHMILTGRGAGPEVVEAADLVTEMKKVKHPYDQGKLAVRGLDF